jgi:hypothetical protein
MWRAQHESHNRALESLGFEPHDEYQDITRKKLRMPLAIMGSVLRGSPQWYSALRKAIKDAKQDKGPIGYWKGQIKNTPGATSESTKTGFDERLTTWGLPPEITKESIGFKEFEGNVTKDEVLGLLEPIELKRTVLGGEGYTSRQITAEDNAGGFLGKWGVFDPEGNLFWPQNVKGLRGRGDHPEVYLSENDAKQAARWHNRQQRPTQLTPRFADRQDLRTAGGTNYREILTQLPKRESSDYWYDRQNEYVQDMHKKYGDGWVNKATDQEIKIRNDLGRRAELAEGPNANYYGGHWTDTGQENTLGHIRVSNITANNLKSLHSDEYQLDWWQAAEKARRREIRRLSQALDISEKEAAKQVPKDYGYVTKPEEMDSDGNVIPQTGEVPDEPFKDKGWELLFKDHFMEAINDPSIEAITWTTGETQADRYSLSRAVEKIDVVYNPDRGMYSITAYPKSEYGGGPTGPPQVYEEIHGDDLGNHIGGELAKKAMDQLNKKVSENIEANRNLAWDVRVEYEGLDLDLGGKFLKFIYDSKVPQFFNKLLKEFNVPSQKVWMGGEEDVGWVIGHPDIGPLVDNRFNIIQFDTREEAEEYFLNNTGFSSDAPREDWGVAPYSSLPEVWQQRITDEMREKFKEGMSLTKREDAGLLGSYA